MILPTYQRIRPAGRSLLFAGRPVDLALSPDGAALYAKSDRGLLVIDARAWALRQELRFPAGGGSMHGIAVSQGIPRRVYVTTAQNELWEAGVDATGRATWGRKIVLPGPGGQGASHPCGIALSADETTAYVCLSRNNSLAVVDLVSGKPRAEITVGVAPFDVALAPDGHTTYVSDWGGRHPRKGERSAPSSGTDTVVDERGVGASGAVSVVDLVHNREQAEIETGLHPSDLELSRNGRRLYVANANSDTVSVIDTRARRVIETVLARPVPALPFGSAPDAVALAPNGRNLYVASAGSNAIMVIALRGPGRQRSRVLGSIPTAWYPGGVVTDGRRLYIAAVKGIGSRLRPPGRKAWHVTDQLGSLAAVEIPSAVVLRRDTAQVRMDSRVSEILQAARRPPALVPRCARGKPVPAGEHGRSVLEHVVYVIKENRTYDQLFGDLPRGNGDPSLCLFGREVTPNHHALAEQFVLLDNFYCNGVVSADGHSWATEGNVTDHLEKSFGGFTRSYTFGDDPLTYSSSGFIWSDVARHGLTFRNYGEMDYAEPEAKSATFTDLYDRFRQGSPQHFKQSIGIRTLRAASCRDYPGWNLKIPDVLRAGVFLKELKEYERKGNWPRFILLYLPNDHTSGTAPSAPTPRAQVADNDRALGRVVEGITHSRFWPRTCIFVVEDDPQDGFDHVDGHRSLCLVISPYTRRSAVVSRFYNQTSVLHTMERIMGLPPMNQMDAMAPLMTDCFTARPDLRPYTCRPNRIPLDEMNPPTARLTGPALYWANQSRRLPLDRPDRAEEDTLNRILWHSVKGVGAPYPAHLAGSHRAPAPTLRSGIQ
jgi:YVTN family beta-propeller protein